jgi:hypothetical protein
MLAQRWPIEAVAIIVAGVTRLCHAIRVLAAKALENMSLLEKNRYKLATFRRVKMILHFIKDCYFNSTPIIYLWLLFINASRIIQSTTVFVLLRRLLK